MPDDTTPGTPQAGGTGDPQPQAGGTPPEPQAGDGNESISLDEAKKLRSEASNLRKRLKAFEDAEQKAKDAQLSEQEKLTKQLAELQAARDTATRQLQERTVNYEVRLKAATMGIVDPDAAAKLLDWSAIEYGDSGAPTNIEDLLKSLLKSKPYLAGKAGQSSGGATNPPRSQSSGDQLSWELISKMTPAQYEARRTEIQQFMLNNPSRRF